MSDAWDKRYPGIKDKGRAWYRERARAVTSAVQEFKAHDNGSRDGRWDRFQSHLRTRCGDWRMTEGMTEDCVEFARENVFDDLLKEVI
jgi:hypothetical protein